MTQDHRTAAARLIGSAAHALQRHPKKLTALVAALLLGGAGGTFAVASIDDAEVLPQARLVVEDVQPLALAAQGDALQAFSFNLHRTEQTRANDTVDSLLSRLGISDAEASAYLKRDHVFRGRLLGRTGYHVTAEATDDHLLVRLSARWAIDDTTFQRLVIERTAGGPFTTRIESAPLVASQRLGSGTISSSLFAAVDEAGIPDAVTMQLVDIYSGAIDFNRGLKKGDRFSVVYETLEGDGEPLRTGRVLSTEFVNGPRTHQALWFRDQAGKGGYYDFDGRSLERAFLASPMEFSRVTSGFAMRFHPIFQQWRAHNGVDYAGPVGAPVRTVADGVVSFAGVQGGYGNVIMIDHGKATTTVYAHLSRIDVKVGSAVTRGQRIGALGATGWATGPHLHFEFRQNGVFRDPLEVAAQSKGVELSPQARPQFEAVARGMRLQLAAAASTVAAASAR